MYPLKENQVNRKIIMLTSILLSVFSVLLSQNTNIQQQGLSAAENLKIIMNLKPYSVGVTGFDNRYAGVRGSPRLFDTLVTSLLQITGQKDYFQLQTDIDLISNTLIFTHPRSGNLTQIPADIVTEVVFTKNHKELTFRTFEGGSLERNSGEKVFCQLLLEKPVLFLKLPLKNLVEASYKGAYSPDRRFDEFQMYNKYYIMGSDSTFHQVQLSKRSLQKLFPEKKSLIDEGFGIVKKGNEEEAVISILEKF